MSQLRRFLVDPDCVLAESLGDLQYLRDRYTVGGNPTIVNSPYGKVVRLNGTTDYLNFGRDASIVNVSNPFTVAVLQKQIATTVNAVPVGFASGATGFMLYQNGASHMNFYVLDYDVDRSVSTDSVTIGSWEWLVGVSTSTTTTIYVNGTAKPASAKGAGALALPSTNPLLIGAYSAADDGTVDNFYNGDIAYILIWKRELSTTEISNLATGKAF